MKTKKHIRKTAGGVANSAARVKRSGMKEPALSRWIWIGGREQRWVWWPDIERQVAQAFDSWRQRKALAGVRVFDAAERLQQDIAEAMQTKALKGR